MSSLSTLFRALLLTTLLLPTLLRGWVSMDVGTWPDGTVTFVSKLGTTPTYTSGYNPNMVATAAATAWNPYMLRLKVTTQEKSKGTGTSSNFSNEIYYSKTYEGETIDSDILAFALVEYMNGTIKETDIVVNESHSWSHYTGSLDYYSIDLQRVLSHEVGHALGLDHPDEAGQYVPALMNSHVNNLSGPAEDDIVGIATLYGVNPAHPPAPPAISTSGYSQTVEERQSAYFYVYPGAASIATFQWKKDGMDILGATARDYTIPSTKLIDAGKYSCVLSNIGGSVSTPEFTLTVTPRKAPVVTIRNNNWGQLYMSQTLSLSAYLSEGSSPVTFQWMKDDVDMPGQTSQYLSIPNVSLFDAGNYAVRATNDVGSNSSTALAITVSSVAAPTLSAGTLTYSIEEGSSLYLYPDITSVIPTTIKWYKDGVLLPGHTSSSFNISYIKSSDKGYYKIEASNISGTVSATYSVAVIPRIEPTGIWLTGPSTYSFGSSPYFSVRTTSSSKLGNDGFSYTWFHDGVPIAVTTSSGYNINAATEQAAGEYYCQLTTPTGIYASNSVQLRFTGTPMSKPWSSSFSHAGIAYFGFITNSRVERLSLLTGESLSALTSPVQVHLLTASSAGVFVSDKSTVHRIHPDGSTTRVWAAQTTGAITCIAANATQLFVGDAANYKTEVIELGTGTLLNTISGYAWSGQCMAIVESKSMMLTFGEGSYSRYSSFVPYSAQGLGMPTGYLHEDSSGPKSLILSHDQHYIFDNTGAIYDTTTQAKAMRLSYKIESIADLDDGSFVLFDGRDLLKLDSKLVEARSMRIPAGMLQIDGQSGKVFGFSFNTATQHVQASEIDISGIKGSLPALASIDPNGYPLGNDAALIDKNGKAWILNRRHHMLVSWDPETRSFDAGFRLRNNPTSMTYIASAHSLYLAYIEGGFSKIDLNEKSPTEVLVGNCEQQINCLSNAGDYLAIHHTGGSWGTLQIWNSNGTLISSKNWMDPSATMSWSAQTDRMYMFQDSSYPNDLKYATIGTDGVIGMTGESPYHGQVDARHPVRASGDGTVLIGSGQLFAESDLKITGSLGAGHIDAIYLSPNWYTIVNTFAGCVITKWDTSTRTALASVTVSGMGRRILVLPNGKLLVLGTYQGSPRFIVLDSALTVLSSTGAGPASRLANLSVQADVGVGNDLLVPGFVIKGKEAKNVLVRGVGPTLTEFGVAGALADPQLTLYNSSSAAIQGNDNWFSLGSFAQVKTRAKELGAFNLGDTSRDAVLMPSLAPGLYTAEVRGANSTTGRAIVEMYDADDAPGEERAVNMSARCKVTGSREAIGGFVIEGKKPMTVLLRAVGPKLLDYSVTGVLADPKLTLFSGQTVVATNNDWSADTSKAEALRQAFTNTGAFALNEGSKDAALLVTLEPGAYTVWMESANGSSGVALLELYVVDTAE